MLVLSREKDEGITITPSGQPPIRVKIVDIRGDKVRLGIDADKSVLVHRDEIQQLVDAERESRDTEDRPTD